MEHQLVLLSPEAQGRGKVADLLDVGRARREQAEREADALYRAQEAQTMRMLGHQPQTYADAVAAMEAEDLSKEQERQRCYHLVDESDVGYRELKELLGIDARRQRAAMHAQQDQLRAKLAQAEAHKSAFEREVDRLKREVASLRGDQDRVWEAMAAQGGY
jgi:hypothetical protein